MLIGIYWIDDRCLDKAMKLELVQAAYTILDLGLRGFSVSGEGFAGCVTTEYELARVQDGAIGYIFNATMYAHHEQKAIEFTARFLVPVEQNLVPDLHEYMLINRN